MPCAASRRRRSSNEGLKEAGFTLIEALVALFVFGLVATLVLGVLSMQARAESTLRGRIEAEDKVVLAQNTLRERMSAMRRLVDPRGGDTAFFRGQSDRLEFIAPTFQAEGPRALYRFRLQVVTGDRLVLYTLNERTSLQATTSEARGWAPLELLDNVTRLEIGYFGPDRFTGADTWQLDWMSRTALPKLVRIRAVMGQGDVRRWPLLIVRPAPQSRKPCGDQTASQNCGDKS